MKHEMEKLDLPDVEEFLEILAASGVRMWACKLAVDMFKLEQKDLFEDVEDIITVGDFYDRAQGEGTQIVFI
jgi:peroxiredoxin family protein